MDIPLPLKQSIETGNCVLFIGAGVGMHLTNKKGESAPSASTLAHELADQIEINSEDATDLKKIATLFDNTFAKN